MPQPILRVERISKHYQLGATTHSGNTFGDTTLFETVRQRWRSLFARRMAGKIADARNSFWALSDVSFTVAPGEIVGIIGRNGAGKSTLLKLLARITAPTTGAIDLYGRVGSLLEVGTGFHPDLTGRENIFLNGAILGMQRAEITRKFDDIVTFAEVEQFLDTPVKRYSSGMYTRLAFAVAAQLEPEILLVDEVLAVGDAEFQKKCLGRMRQIGANGRTVLFVSHNLNAVEKLCSRALLLERGKLVADSNDVRAVVHRYLTPTDEHALPGEWHNHQEDFISEWFQPTRLAITDEYGHTLPQPLSNASDFFVCLAGNIETHDPGLQLGFALYAESGELLFWSNFTDRAPEAWPVLQTGKNQLCCRIPRRWLNEGRYRVELIASLHYRAWILEPERNAPFVEFDIQGGLSDSPLWLSKRPGLFAPELSWHAQQTH